MNEWIDVDRERCARSISRARAATPDSEVKTH